MNAEAFSLLTVSDDSLVAMFLEDSGNRSNRPSSIQLLNKLSRSPVACLVIGEDLLVSLMFNFTQKWETMLDGLKQKGLWTIEKVLLPTPLKLDL